MTAHTSGPWFWVEGTDAINRRWNNQDWTVASVGRHRLSWHEDESSEGREAGANAQLIAAAPDLLAALQAFNIQEQDVIGGDVNNMIIRVPLKTIEQMALAVAKATRSAA